MKLIDEPEGVEVVNEDVLNLAQAILRSIVMLATNQRSPRRQAASYLGFTSKGDFDGNSILVHLDEPARIANFCKGGGFHMASKARSWAPENRE